MHSLNLPRKWRHNFTDMVIVSRIGMGEQLPGFELAVRSMCVGEESEFVIRHK